MKVLLNVNEKEKVCSYKDTFPVASQQNTAHHFSLLRDTPISRCSSVYVLSEKSMWENLASANTKSERCKTRNTGETTTSDRAVKFYKCATTDEVIKREAKKVCRQ